jgi:hypothetical protein
MPPPEPRASLPPSEPPVLQADGLHPVQEAPDPRDLSEDERASSWLHTALGFEVG